MKIKALIRQFNKQNNHTPEFIQRVINECLKNVGNTDPFIRDELAFNTFAKCMIEENIKEIELELIIQECIENIHIKDGVVNDEVFKRSFSILYLMCILFRDNQEEILSVNQYKKITISVIQYFNKENDIRGFVTDKGWAHGIAHASDAIIEIIKSRYYEDSYTNIIFEGVRNNLLKLQFNHVPYIDDEDERMSSIIVALLKYDNVEERIIVKWLSTLSISKTENGNQDISYYRKMKNIKDFKKSLYFMLEDYPNLQNSIKLYIN
ncbi:DUF2785 domain-containing protein [Macrococcus capreoli]|uniref:DUF2785 domain-containing protein n=1 Tax=Macrococcus capreoli TaxID=2982690 RepID=UPI003F442EE7